MKAKISSRIQYVKQLAEIAEEEPQITYAAYIKGLSHMWSSLQRTIGAISELFRPLKEAIRTILLSSLCNRPVTDLDRDMIALPLRHGGLGIQNPVLMTEIMLHHRRSLSLLLILSITKTMIQSNLTSQLLQM